MIKEEALGWIIVGAINDHFPHPEEEDLEDPVMGTMGCTINCGPCGALHSLDEEGRRWIEHLIRMTGYPLGGGWCYWDDANDRLRWGWFEWWWDAHKGCGSVNGNVQPCVFEDDDDE